MLQRGRKSAASQVVPLVDGTPPVLQAPANLAPVEREVFENLVATIDRKHFRPSDLPLLCAYCRAIVFEERAGRELTQDPTNTKWLAVWEKAGRAIVQLAGKLRLSPQSRQHATTTARMSTYSGPRPWDDARR